MASILRTEERQTEVVNLSDNEESGKPLTGCNSLHNGKNSNMTPSSSTSVFPDDTISSHSPNFEKFIDLSKARMRKPGDEKIIARLKKNYEIILNKSNEIDKFFDTLCSKINKVPSEIEFYKILTEGLKFLKNNQSGTSEFGSQHDKVLQTRITKLEKRLEELDKKIKEVQAREVNWDDSDEESTNFILEGRLKKKFMKVYEYLCKLTNSSARDEDPKIHFNGTRYPEINKNIRKYLNKMREFPDFPTILEIVSQTNEREELRISNVESLAKEAFEEVGKVLKKRRMDSDAETFGSYLTDGIVTDDSQDPANYDSTLKEQLERNSVISKKRADERFEHYVKEQEKEEELGKVEPSEVDDEIAENGNGHENDEEETETDDAEEDEAIIEDKSNFSNYRYDKFNVTSSSCTSEDVPRSPSEKTDSGNSTKKRRQSNGLLDKVLAKIPKQCEEVIELSD